MEFNKRNVVDIGFDRTVLLPGTYSDRTSFLLALVQIYGHCEYTLQ